MKAIGKILMMMAMVITIAHSVIPHQHRVQLQLTITNILSSCCDSETESANLLKKIDNIIKHVNLGEKHLENYRVSSYNFEFSPVAYFEISNILSVLEFKLLETKIVKHQYHYKYNFFSEETSLSSGLRAPPSI